MGNAFSDDREENDYVDDTGVEENFANSDIELNQDESDIMSSDDVISNYEKIVEDLLAESKKVNRICVYKDEKFPPRQSSLWKRYDGRNVTNDWFDIEWKRPHNFCRTPRLTTNSFSTDDIVQGSLGDCWWLSSVASISQNQTRMAKIVPSPQPCYGQTNYTGAFHFRFWQFGEWVDVVIDDLVPTIQGQLCFAKSSDDNELWISLLEKAYAKMYGCYHALIGGLPSDALEDLTGGLAVTYYLGNETPKHLKRTLSKALRNETLVCAGIEGQSEGDNIYLKKSTGLISGHAYSVLKFAQVKRTDGKIDHLLKVRNPWGQGEWKKVYSDRSTVWQLITRADRDRLDYEIENDGEWWMRYEDFIQYFSEVTLCTIGPDFNEDGVASAGDKWLLSSVKSGWKGSNAGGSRNDLSSYSRNPQYRLSLLEADDFDENEDDESSAGKCSVVIGLMQKDGRGTRYQNLPIAINVYKLDDVEDIRRRQREYFFAYQSEICGTGHYRNYREVTITTELPVGEYLVVPSTFNSGQERDFLIRVYTEKAISITELVD